MVDKDVQRETQGRAVAILSGYLLEDGPVAAVLHGHWAKVPNSGTFALEPRVVVGPAERAGVPVGHGPAEAGVVAHAPDQRGRQPLDLLVCQLARWDEPDGVSDGFRHRAGIVEQPLAAQPDDGGDGGNGIFLCHTFTSCIVTILSTLREESRRSLRDSSREKAHARAKLARILAFST